MIPVRGYRDAQVAVLGLGRSGLTAALALRAGGAIPVVWDDNEAARQKALDEGIEVADLTKDKSWEDVVSLIVSPGIPHLYPTPHPIVQKAWSHGVVVDNDIGLFFRSYATQDWEKFDTIPKVICVTGSNGKSTTTALIQHILNAAGRNATMAGNIGRGVLDLPPARDGDVVVLELSSYQTDLARALAPDVAVFMNLSPDHLDRHNGMGGYFAAKRRLFIEGGPDKAIIGVDEPEGRFLANQIRQDKTGDPVIAISSGQKLQGQGWSVFARKGFLAEWRKNRQVASIDLRDIVGLPGAHNHQNACAAYAACRSLNIPPKVIEAALKTYPGLPHRCQVLGKGKDVLFVNDSKATNIDAAEQALKAFKNIRWIVGGQAKEGGITALAPLFDRVKKAYLIGEATTDFASQLGTTPQSQCETIERAVAAAVADADAGDVILLAPACASFDQYPNFEKRGDAFIAAVTPHLDG
ncbi:UDP-N-acetylmuramoylalanine--D-glutamate ligase [Amylibacter kogurei]|uniref:UDP-N-acetylmuramoylalanine--D-glutamate ligase n=1 Tax=Paramylibacter kogurei TaxID=1889778 RepID=A0A2G5K5B3_9RHOB|nr:UDP-N-acetylmuramoyl-L-alanine--D-glutamate ligase [Amylibacter kogurei]PIB24213.1 UDP-N-acetylmuramoylalanine--D-glutamate ligase [Amylibacter kogurei]